MTQYRSKSTERGYEFCALFFAVLAVIGCAVWGVWMLIRDAVKLAWGMVR